MNKLNTPKYVSALSAVTATAMLVGSADAAIYTWSSSNPAGPGQNNQINNAANWSVSGPDAGTDPATPSASGNQIDTNSADDEVIFNASLGGNRQPASIYTRTSTNWGVIRVQDGDILWRNDGNSQGNYSYSDALSGTPTMIVGDGIGAANSAIARFNLQNWNQGGGDKTYVIYADGTLASARTGNYNYSNGVNDTVMRIIGGTVDFTGNLDELDLLSDANDYFTFEDFDSTLTFGKGAAGWFDEASDVTSGFSTNSGGAFLLAGSLNAGNAEFQLTDNGSSWTIGVNAIPEPSTTALFGLGGLLLLRRRR